MDSETGSIEFDGGTGEGGNVELDLYATQVQVREVAHALEVQTTIGVLFGMSRGQYIDYVSSGGVALTPAPEIGGSVSHHISATDTAETLEAAYAVDIGRILLVNGMTPDEALPAGTVLQIPQVRARGSQGIEGLPTFGSHVGQSALGIDLPLEMTATEDGDLSVVSGADVMEQGVVYLIDAFASDLLKRVQGVPTAAREQYLVDNLTQILLTDRRVKSVSSVDVAQGDTHVDLAVTLQTINGNTVRTGRP